MIGSLGPSERRLEIDCSSQTVPAVRLGPADRGLRSWRRPIGATGPAPDDGPRISPSRVAGDRPPERARRRSGELFDARRHAVGVRGKPAFGAAARFRSMSRTAVSTTRPNTRRSTPRRSPRDGRYESTWTISNRRQLAPGLVARLIDLFDRRRHSAFPGAAWEHIATSITTDGLPFCSVPGSADCKGGGLRSADSSAGAIFNRFWGCRSATAAT